jgi:pimeloyl-ACP methyl ester carboxylesterase
VVFSARKVAVMGIGGGGPLAMELVKRYPQKCWAFVLLGAVTRKWQPPEEASFEYALLSQRNVIALSQLS